MKKYLLLLCLMFTVTFVFAQENKSGKQRVYCELSGKPDNLSFDFGKEPIPQFDFSMKKAYPKDKNGKKIKFDTNIT